MKLAVLTSTVPGEIDRLLSETAGRLQAEGLHLTGVVKLQEDDPDAGDPCHTSLRVLPDGPGIRITQALGEGATGCRLNPAAITEAVATVEHRGVNASDLFILNKFGPLESEGRGFCTAISSALERDVPVLVGVTGACRDAFESFAGGMAEVLSPDREALHKWCVEAASASGTR